MTDFNTANHPAVVAHFNGLQAVITRLANNSVQCKTWALTLVSALLAAAASTHQPHIALASFLPLLFLGYMDVRYLAQERAYRGLYNTMVEKIRTSTYTMDDLYSMSAAPSVGEVLKTVSSWAILPIYPMLIAFLLLSWACGWLNLLSGIPA